MGLGIKTYLQFKLGEWTGRHPDKFEGHYTMWRARRINAILDHYGHRYFVGKSVLELGAGYGAIGAFFSLLGADVTCVEGRESNTRVIRERYPFLTALTHDLSAGWPKTGRERYDVIVHFGLLYHLGDPEPSLRESCRRTDQLILETEVSDSDDAHFIKGIKEHSYHFGQSVEGAGSRPSPAWVERILTEEGMTFSRITDDRCNWELHRYDWPITNSKAHANGQRRMWFAQRAKK
ncbi:MAG: class I SAM-dependent methyltransferase [Verrucomicrobia bacterium]|nr:class I SAM-dependent methyltransferase [Verrucomicrobiota bacterium]